MEMRETLKDKIGKRPLKKLRKDKQKIRENS